MNIIRMSFFNFFRRKSNIILLIMLAMCLAVLETTIFYKSIVQTSMNSQMDTFSTIVFSAFKVMTVVIVVAIFAVLPVVAMLKLKDSAKFISLLKAIGYQNKQISIMQSAEYFFLLLTSFLVSIIISIASIQFILKTLLQKFTENINSYMKFYIYSDATVLVLLLMVYLLIFLSTSFEIKKLKPLYFNKARYLYKIS